MVPDDDCLDVVEAIRSLAKEEVIDEVKGPFGIGTMVGFTVFNGDKNKTFAFTHKLFEKGVISFIAGENPTRVRFLVPADPITEEDIKNVCAIVQQTIQELKE